jgi:hypothetical protein
MLHLATCVTSLAPCAPRQRRSRPASAPVASTEPPLRVSVRTSGCRKARDFSRVNRICQETREGNCQVKPSRRGTHCSEIMSRSHVRAPPVRKARWIAITAASARSQHGSTARAEQSGSFEQGARSHARTCLDPNSDGVRFARTLHQRTRCQGLYDGRRGGGFAMPRLPQCDGHCATEGRPSECCGSRRN